MGFSFVQWPAVMGFSFVQWPGVAAGLKIYPVATIV
jgi:hypothetical protein